MSYWKNTVIDLGVITQGKPQKVVFYAKDTIPLVKHVQPFCGCTSVKYHPEKKQLNVTYSNGKIPDQVMGPQTVAKKIEVTYEDDKKEILIIKAIRVR